MQYLNYVYDNSDTPVIHTGPVAEREAEYLHRASTHLQPLSDEEYMTGPAGILSGLAKSSYVLDGSTLYWCVEWEPGLIIVQMRPNHEMQWVALRSPSPDFAGREPLPVDGKIEDYDPDENPQYDLIFTPWDAQYDAEYRKFGSFLPADEDVLQRFSDALRHANELGSAMQKRFSNDTSKWYQNCRRNIEKWAGNGVRIANCV